MSVEVLGGKADKMQFVSVVGHETLKVLDASVRIVLPRRAYVWRRVGVEHQGILFRSVAESVTEDS